DDRDRAAGDRERPGRDPGAGRRLVGGDGRREPRGALRALDRDHRGRAARADGALAQARHAFEAGDAVGGRGVGGEEVADPAARERVGDHEGAGGGQLRVLRQRHRPGARLDLAEGGGEGEGVAGEAGAGGVGGVLAGAADGHLDGGGGGGAGGQHHQGAEQGGGAGGVGGVLAGAADGHLDDGGGDGAEDEHHQGAEQAGAVVVLVAAERDEDRHVGQVGDDGGDRGGHGRDEDVAVVDVRQLVAED